MNLLIIPTVDFNRHGIPIAILNNYRKFNHKKIHCTFAINGSIDSEYAEEIRSYGDQILILPNRKKQTFSYIKKLRGIAKEKRFDVAHVHGNSATMLFELVALKGVCKTICQAHTTGGIHSIINFILYPMFITMTKYRAACSEEAGRFLFKKHDFKVLDNGIDTSKYLYKRGVKENIRNANMINEEKVILHVGSFCYCKNHVFLVNVFEQVAKNMNNVVLWLVGDGEDMDNIQRLVIEKKLEHAIKFIGKVNNVWDYMIAADCFCLPSRIESFGIVNIEAQAAGLPCLISDVVPSKVKLLKNVEFLSLKESVQVWGEKLENILKCSISDEERKVANMIVKKSEYDTNKTSIQLQQYYETVINSH